MKINDMVICIKDEDSYWAKSKNDPERSGPKTHEILIIKDVNENGYLNFNEYPEDSFNPIAFKLIPKQNESIYIKIESKKVIETEKIISN